MKLKNHRRTGAFTLVEIMIVVAIIGLLAAIAIPNFVRARETSQQNACVNNLRQIDAAKDQWALEKGKSTGDSVVEAEVNQYLRRAPKCPVGDGPYLYQAVGTNAICNNANTEVATKHNNAYQGTTGTSGGAGGGGGGGGGGQ